MRRLSALIIVVALTVVVGCSQQTATTTTTTAAPTVPQTFNWGIYALDLSSEGVTLIYSSSQEVVGLNLDGTGETLTFSLKSTTTEAIDTTSEIYSVGVDGSSLARLTNNSFFDAYPSFSPTGTQIVFLSMRGGTLDLYIMNSDGSSQQQLYDSGVHDADVDWGSAGRITFTRDSQIWSIQSDGSDPQQVTDPANAGDWGEANLPIGDYDPRYSPDGSKIAFERMVDVSYANGGYDIYVINSTGTGEIALTSNGSSGYAQGFANWSQAGDKIVYILAAVGSEGRFDLYLMNSDGSDNQNITPSYFPANFLCHNAVFSSDDSKIYFIGQWYE